jgi:hypothetical protein
MSIETQWKGENHMLEIIVNAAVIIVDLVLIAVIIRRWKK